MLLTRQRPSPVGRRRYPYARFAGFSVTADRPVAFQVDGDYLGERVSGSSVSVPDALQVVV